jgi:flagellin
MNSYRNYNVNTRAINKNLEKLSSGYKINRAGDDAAGLAISEKMRAQITGLETAQKNAKDGISLIQTAEGAATEIHAILNRMYELSEQSANGTYDDAVDRAQLQKEVTENIAEIDRIAQNSKFNGVVLLDGNFTGKKFQIGDGSSETLDVDIDGAQASDLGVDSVDISTQSGATSAIDAIKAGINTLSGIRGQLGAWQNRLEHTINNLSVMQENMQDAESTIRDTDVANEMMKYTKNSILVQSAQAMLAQANQQPQGVLQLLQ